MGSGLEQPPLAEQVRLYSRTTRRSRHRYGMNLSGMLGRLDPHLVFVIGCPRSGTTFTANSLGSVPGFLDLGEVKRLKAGVPGLYAAVRRDESDRVVRALRRIVSNSQRAGMAARRRAIEQTPESTFLVPQLAEAFPRAQFLHVVRDGRDVVSSLLDRGWLAGDGSTLVAARSSGKQADEVGHPFGGYSRFWVEPGREAEFESASETRRCAWAWRRYVSAALSAIEDLRAEQVATIRYEQLVTDVPQVTKRMSEDLRIEASADEVAGAFAGVHADSVGLHTRTLDEHQLAEVLAEIGPLLRQLGYADAAA